MSNFKHLLVNDISVFSEDTDLRWMPQDLADDESMLVQVMAWFHQAITHYLNQCWLRWITPYVATRPQWVKWSGMLKHQGIHHPHPHPPTPSYVWVDGFSATLIILIASLKHAVTQGPVFCHLIGVSSGYAQPITGQVTEVTCPVIGRAQPELTPSKRQKTGPGLSLVEHRLSLLQSSDRKRAQCIIQWIYCSIELSHWYICCQVIINIKVVVKLYKYSAEIMEIGTLIILRLTRDTQYVTLIEEICLFICLFICK